MIVGIGTDLVEVVRMQEALSRHGERLAARILTPDELDEFHRSAAQDRFLSKRFAAKEAAAKALGTGFAEGLGWQDIAVTHNALGRPELRFQGAGLRLLQKLGATRSHLTIADERGHAVAFVVLEQDTLGADVHSNTMRAAQSAQQQ
ncbi:MAG: holo-ACP synthase [Gammaproteobacteria bacterium]|jgi:holo-[acyl-carrier protein] synthase